MLFEVVQYPHLSGSEVVPRVKLVPVAWDDYGYSTSFDAYLVQQSGQQVPLGRIKVLQVGSKRTLLPNTFDALDHHYGSLGQSPSFYEAMERLGRMGSEIQIGLRDVTMVAPSEEILGELGFRDSLLRSPIAQLAYDRRTHRDLGPTVEFRWYPRKKILGSDGIEFRFSTAEPFGRVMVLVGENAAGKTDALARLALALSGARREGEIQPNPGLSRVLAVSFSAFDDFLRPRSGNILYEYLGLRVGERDQVDVDVAFGLLHEQRKAIAAQERDVEWQDALACAGLDPTRLDEGPSALLSTRISTLSAGQKFVFFVFTNLVAKLKKRSLVLFDEPELHTHPRMLSGMMRALGRLLDRFDSFAILATHSPIVLQEVPARSIRIFERSGDGPDDGVMVSKYPRESFGAPLDEIVRFGFRVNAEERNFHQRLEEMMKDGEWTREDVEAVLQEPLSLSSRLLVEQLRSRSS
jgi:hypothetical protein